VADKDVQIDIVVGAEGTVGAVKALDSVTAALTDIRGGGGRVTSTMRAIASAADRMGGRVAASAGSVEAAAKSLATLRNTAASLQEAYSAIAAANVGASPKQRLEMFGEDNVRALIASQEALSANAIKDYNEVANAAAETARLQRIETERVAAAIRSNELAALREVIQARSRLLEQGRNSRSNGFAAVQEQEYKNLLASMSPLEAAQRRLTDATANEARARAAATSAGASYAAAVRHYGKGSMEAAEAAIRHGAALQELARAMGATRTAQANLNTVTERAERGLRDMGVRVFPDTPRLEPEVSGMARFRVPYPPEFRRQMVELVRSGRTPEDLSREFEPTAQSIWNRVRQAERDGGARRGGGVTKPEREELTKLRRESHRLRQERDILAKAAAWFARERTPNGSSSS